MSTPKFNTPRAEDVFEFAYPFIRETITLMEDGESYSAPSWRPGTREEYSNDDFQTVADGMGAQIISVIGTYQPKGFPLRIFYTRKWRDPDGKEFGKWCCRVISICGFRGIIGGYRRPFEMAKELIAGSVR